MILLNNSVYEIVKILEVIELLTFGLNCSIAYIASPSNTLCIYALALYFQLLEAFSAPYLLCILLCLARVLLCILRKLPCISIWRHWVEIELRFEMS